LKKGYKVYGTFRRTSTPNFWRLQHLDIYSKLHLIPADLVDMGSMIEAIQVSDPDEIYNLAASSFVSTAFEQPVGNAEITGIAVTQLLESIRFVNKNIKFYQASSSEMYGNNKPVFQNEQTAFMPSSPYAAAKLYAHWMTDIYKNAYGMFATSGILFNHESPLRGLEFVTRKISNEIAKISLGLSKKLELGNILAKRDWGYAPEYVEGIWKSLQIKNPDDYILATNESHSVKEFVEKACQIADVSTKCLKITKNNLRPLDVNHLKGDYSKAKRKLGWKPKIKFNNLVKIMVEEDIHRWEQRLKGEYLPWDAGNS